MLSVKQKKVTVTAQQICVFVFAYTENCSLQYGHSCYFRFVL